MDGTGIKRTKDVSGGRSQREGSNSENSARCGIDRPKDGDQ